MLSERVVGRGQVEPGPSRFASPVYRFVTGAAVLLIAVVAATSRFLFSTLLVGHSDDRFEALAVALVVGVAFLATGRVSAARALRRGPAALAFVAGAVLGAGVPLAVALSRHSDAPSGTVVVFWTAVVPGALLLALGIPRLAWSRRAHAVALSVAVLAGGTGILGNWERPSSLTLLTRYVPEQLYLGLSSLALVVAVLVLGRLVRGARWAAVAPYAGAGSLVAALAIALTSGQVDAMTRALMAPDMAAYAIGTATLVVLAVVATSRGRTAVAAAGLVLVPVALSALVFVEAAVGALGPEPILRGPVAWGSLLVMAAAAAFWRLEAEAEAEAEGGDRGSRGGLPVAFGRSTLPKTAALVGLAAVAAALAGLMSPGIAVSVDGRLTDTSAFSAAFELRGFETVGGWLALAAAACSATLPVASRAWRLWAFSVAVALVALAAWPVLAFTPLHTWVSWIPAEVQQDYGTEYARIVFEPVSVVWQQVALGGAAVASALSAAVWLGRAGRRRAEESEEVEGA